EPSVTETASAAGQIGAITALALLLPATASSSPAGTLTVAVLVTLPHCVAPTMAVIVNVTDPPPAGRNAVPEIAPEPEVVPLTTPPGQLAPPDAVHVHAVNVKPDCTASATAALASCAVTGATVGAAVVFVNATV